MFATVSESVGMNEERTKELIYIAGIHVDIGNLINNNKYRWMNY